jgi:hypothetical protein
MENQIKRHGLPSLATRARGRVDRLLPVEYTEITPPMMYDEIEQNSQQARRPKEAKRLAENYE